MNISKTGADSVGLITANRSEYGVSGSGVLRGKILRASDLKSTVRIATVRSALLAGLYSREREGITVS